MTTIPFLSVMDFGAVGNGTTDDTAAINSALSAASPGQEVWLSSTGKHLVDSANIVIPPGVQLRAGWKATGGITTMEGVGASFNLAGLNGALILNPLYTVSVGFGSGINGVPIYRKGLVIPATTIAAFAGTAVTVDGDDTYVGSLMILGFNVAVSKQTHTRCWLEKVKFDCNSGILFNNSAGDIDRLYDCQGWPFCTYIGGNSGTPDARAGASYYLFACVEPFLLNCFSHGYAQGFQIFNSGGATLINCYAEATGPAVAGECFNVGNGVGAATGTKLIGCTSWSQAIGLQVNLPVNDYISVTECSFRSTGAAINVIQGDVRIIGGLIDGAVNGIDVRSASSTVLVDGMRMENLTGPGVNNLGASPNIILRNLDLSQLPDGTPVATNLVNKTIASAATVNLPALHDFFTVSGTTNISTLVGGWGAREITLLFQGVLTVVNSATLRLSGGANYTTASGSTLTLRSNGSGWFEVGRA